MASIWTLVYSNVPTAGTIIFVKNGQSSGEMIPFVYLFQGCCEINNGEAPG